MSAAAKPIPAAASPRAATPTPPREDAAELLKNSPFPGAADDAADDAAALARAAERARRLLDRPPAPRDVAYLRTLAWDRHCQGVATQDIADEFDLPARTVRAWLAATRDELAGDLAELRKTHLLLAVAALRRLLATTWELLEAERDATLPLLESLAVLPGAGREAARARPSQAPRYIAAVLAIQKELDRLLALDAATLVPTPPVPAPAGEPRPPAETAAPPDATPSAADPATPAPTAQVENAAEMATPPRLDADAAPTSAVPPLPAASDGLHHNEQDGMGRTPPAPPHHAGEAASPARGAWPG